MIRAFTLTVVLLPLASCASVGPDRVDLAAALQVDEASIRAARCYAIPEEPTEFGCRYQQRNEAGRWRAQQVMVAIDGSAWIIIDGPQ